MKINAAITSGASPPARHDVMPNDPAKQMAAQIDKELLADAKAAIKEMRTAEEAEAYAEGALETKSRIRAEKAIAAGHVLLKARDHHKGKEAWKKFLKSIDMDDREDRKLRQVASGKSLKELDAAAALASKEYRKRQRDIVRAANAPPKVSKAKQRAEANGLGLSTVRALIKQVCEVDKLGHASVVETLARYKKKDGTGAATSAGQLNWSDYNAVREDLTLLLKTYGHEPEVVREGAHGEDEVPGPVEPYEGSEAEAINHGETDEQSEPEQADEPHAWDRETAALIKRKGMPHGFDGADSFGRDGADRNSKALAEFKDECRTMPCLSRMNEEGIRDAAAFLLSGEWKTVEEDAA